MRVKRRTTLTALEAPTLLFVSMQWHPHWRARITSAAGGVRGSGPLRVNDFYLGVALPPGSQRVELEFRPWSRWMWVTHVLFAAGAAVAAWRAWRARAGALSLPG